MISKIQNNKINNEIKYKNKQQSFKGPMTGAVALLRGLNKKPALGACAVDICSMVTPRTVIETKNRGPQSGIETLIREGSSCLLHACLGLIGFGAATLISGKFNNKYGVKAQNIIANSETINNMSSLWEKTGGNQKEFFKEFLNNIQGLNGSQWRNISEEGQKVITENLVKISEKRAQLTSQNGIGKKEIANEIKALKGIVTAQIIKDTGAEASYTLNAIKDSAGNIIHKSVSSSASELVDNALTLSDALKTKSKEKLPEFIKALKNNKNIATILGLGICSLMCISIQPINRYLTKKRTGKDGFVGVKNKEADKSKGFKALKTGLGLAFPIFGISTIGKPSELLSKVQFNSKIPALNHFKLVYSLTICSRFMSARDKNELRESVIKDTLGYTNWLLLGGVVSKLAARAIGGKELINNPLQQTGQKGVKYAAKWLTKSSVKTFDEVLLPKSKEIVKNGKLMNFSQLLKNADSATKSKIAKIAMSQFAGYLYSGLVLGIGIAKLNIFITKQVQAKKDAKKQMNEEISKQDKIDTSYIAKTENKTNSVFKDFN